MKRISFASPVLVSSLLAFSACSRVPERTTVDAAAPSAEIVTLETFLARYWGERWPEVRPRISRQACDMKQPVSAVALARWDDVAGKIEPDLTILSQQEIDAHCSEALSWFGKAAAIDDLDLVKYGINAQDKPLSKEHWARIHAIIAPFDADLRALGRASAEQFSRFTTKLWNEQHYWRCPFVAIDPKRTDGAEMLFLRSYAAGNWHVTFALHRGEEPEFDELWKLVGEISTKRAQAVHDYIASI